MKKLLLLSSIGMVISVSLFLWCCDRSDSSENIPQTEADRFVASAEYQRFSREIDDFSGRIYQSLSAMSLEDRAKAIEICTEAQKTENLDQVMTLVQELQILTGVDYIGHSRKMNELSKGIFENQKFTSDEFIKAIHKYRFLDGTTPQTRTAETTESTVMIDTMTPVEQLINACIYGCKTSYSANESLCIQGQHKHGNTNDSVSCKIMREFTLTACIDDCINKYSKTEPSEPSGPAIPIEPAKPTEPEPEKPVAPTNPSTTMTVNLNWSGDYSIFYLKDGNHGLPSFNRYMHITVS